MVSERAVAGKGGQRTDQGSGVKKGGFVSGFKMRLRGVASLTSHFFVHFFIQNSMFIIYYSVCED